MPLELIYALIGIPFGIFSNLTTGKLQSFIDKHSFLADGLDRIFVNSFLTTIKEHNKKYDSTSATVLDELSKQIKHDPNSFLQVFSGDKTIHALNDPEYIRTLSQQISLKYNITDDGLCSSIIRDCLSDYLRCFYANLNEKGFMSIVLSELFENSSRLEDAILILAKIDERTSWINHICFRDALLGHFSSIDEEYQKVLSEYDLYIQRRYKQLQLRGFTPHIGSAAVAMDLEDIFVPMHVSPDQNNNMNRGANLEIDEDSEPLLSFQHSVLLGKPGSGKSTLLKHIALSVVMYRNKRCIPLKHIVPIFFKVSDYAESYKLKRENLHDFLCNRVETRFKSFLNTTLLCSNALVLIDGLDEVTDKVLRLKIADRIEEFISVYPKSQCIVTSRIIGYDEVRLSTIFEHFLLSEFNDAQIKAFADNWIKATHKGLGEQEISIESKGLYNSIHQNESVLKLATNPLLMTIIAMIYFKGSRLPNSRIELYEFSTETFLESWVRLRVEQETQLKSKDEIIEILCPIAYELHRDKSDARIGEKDLVKRFEYYYHVFHSSASRDTIKKETREFIDFLREQAGFFYEVGTAKDGEKLFSFMHLTFEEYFAAMYIANDFNEGGTLWRGIIFKSRWSEILRLAAAHLSSHMKRKKTTEFINAIMLFPDDFPEIGRKEVLLSQVFSDDIIVYDDCKQKVIATLSTYLKSNWSRFNRELFSQLKLYTNFNDDLVSQIIKELPKINDSQLCESSVPSILFRSCINSVQDSNSFWRKYVSQASQKVLKRLSSCFDFSEYAVQDLEEYFIVLFEYLSDFKLEDFPLFYRLLDRSHQRVISEQLMQLLYEKALTNETVRKLIIMSSTWGFKNGQSNVTMLFPDGFLSNEESKVIRLYETHWNKFYPNSLFRSDLIDHRLWQFNFGFEKKALHVDVLCTDPWTYFDVHYRSSKFALSDIAYLNHFPENVRKIFYAMLIKKNLHNKSLCDMLFLELQKIGVDAEFTWGMEEYIAMHVNENPIFDQLFLYNYDRRNSKTFDISEAKLRKIISRPFNYEPSPPLKAIVCMTLKKKVSKELLIDVRQFALNADQCIQRNLFDLLSYLVNSSL